MTLRLSILMLALNVAVFAAETNLVSTNAISTNAISSAPTTNAASTTVTNAPSATNTLANVNTNTISESSQAIADSDVASFNEFKIITERNIFDPNRSAPGRVRRNEDKPKPTRVDYLNLVGAMSYDKGRFAFFDGSSSEYRKSVKPGDSIAGYKVAEVSPDKVTLQSGDKKIDLPVGGQMKRQDEGEWQVNSNPESFASSTNSSSSSSGTAFSNGSKPTSSSSDEENPVLKRLLEQRRQAK